jgi:hypothetical protein
MPTVKTIPAIPGKVRVDPKIDKTEIKITIFNKREIFAKTPNNLYA